LTHCNRDAVGLWKIRPEQILQTILQIVFIDLVTCYSYTINYFPPSFYVL
jgi:hypothetical protein